MFGFFSLILTNLLTVILFSVALIVTILVSGIKPPRAINSAQRIAMVTIIGTYLLLGLMVMAWKGLF